MPKLINRPKFSKLTTNRIAQ